MRYQFVEPFEMDSTASHALLGLDPTPWDRITQQTVAWWRAHLTP
ncbi:MAG: hypothetical protein NVV66_05385 [Cellulomonas sp.]|nr:hypothetical protein [Cellulomonas sp.]MCR6704128.1 hypothetical protein [Cellulomonas sp.]